MDVPELIRLQISLLQKVRSGKITEEHWNWFNNLKPKNRDWLCSSKSHINHLSNLLRSFRLTVPKDYDHETQLASFAANNVDEFQFIHEVFAKEQEEIKMQYTECSQKLTAGKSYTVKLLNVDPKLPFEDYLEFLNEQKALFVGAPGLSLVWQMRQEEFPKETWIFSLDREQKDWDPDYYYGVPTIILSKKGWHFNQFWLNILEFDKGNTSGINKYALLYFCEDCVPSNIQR